VTEVSKRGDLGATFAAQGDRYTPRGTVRHRTRPNLLELFTRNALCGMSGGEWYWRGTGSQEEYERLAVLPRCARCVRAEEHDARHDPLHVFREGEVES
jgi:hypothetical protein